MLSGRFRLLILFISTPLNSYSHVVTPLNTSAVEGRVTKGEPIKPKPFRFPSDIHHRAHRDVLRCLPIEAGLSTHVNHIT